MSEQHFSSIGWRFDTSYTQLPAPFHVRESATRARDPHLVIFNHALAEQLGLNAAALTDTAAAQLFSGNQVPEGATPLAQAYAGHQFGGFSMLGDGRALLLGEHITPDGMRVDIQLKGSGVTPYSRRGDGRAALGPMLREYIISEAMHALGIPTTRSLAVVTTGEPVYRETPLPGAVLTRVAASHIRVGTFQYAYVLEDPAALKALADYTIQRHYPEAALAENPYLAFLNAVCAAQAALVAKWMQVGFIHGVMNTDNMAISGETIDYGPCAFMDRYAPATVFSSIDRQGRYAYSNQPPIAQWNLARFAETLLPLLHEDKAIAIRLAESAVYACPEQYQQYWLAGMRLKLGLLDEAEDDAALVEELLTCMQHHGMDFTNSFRRLSVDQTLPNADAADVQNWLTRWQQRVQAQTATPQEVSASMRAANPAVIARNHQVEAALDAATDHGDLGPLHQLLAVLAKPFEETPENLAYRSPAPPSDEAYQTFCGT
ncbi:protein adenylyltransferase SelO [Methylobacillus flagellatus]|uniref:protein adenylyltransferase SelO n=1 Tax=Methylobacillus flagellatus TaxID=405 RepID=UPI0010F72628|nr:YdiU family protein [Methylobacillus flagellatus]